MNLDNRELFFEIANRPGEQSQSSKTVTERQEESIRSTNSLEFVGNCAGAIVIIILFVIAMIL